MRTYRGASETSSVWSRATDWRGNLLWRGDGGFGAMVQMPPTPDFDPRADLISLHQDHAPDKDDGQSAAADRTLLESLCGRDWLATHGVAISGTYRLNKDQFNPESDAVMDATFGYYDPAERLDFSDTGELLFLLGLGQMPIDEFRERFLAG